jgi:tripartite-type tricarboxylate transporter receptor subunit TctC
MLWIAIGAALLSQPASAADYPGKPIRFIVGFPPGGGGDLIARVVGQGLAGEMGQTVIIDNRAGAGGVIGSDIVAKAPPDGYTLLLGTTGAITISPSLQSRMLYDPRTDFSPVGMIGSFQNVVVVPAASGVRSLKDLIDAARRQPGKINFGSAGVGTTFHMAGEMLRVMADVNIVHVPYKGNGPAMTDLIAGRLDCMFPTLPSALPYLKTDRLRALAVTGPARSPALADVPTVAETGLSGYRVVNWYGVLAPARTPASIVDKLNGVLNKVVRSAEVQEHLSNQGIASQTSSPAQFRAFIAGEISRWAAVIKSAGIKAEE